MDVASLCPLPVGVVRWQSPGRSLTVIVKMSLSLAGSDVALAEPQEPLSLDRPLEGGAPDELYYASDFAPRKARCDVLLAGSARAETPSPVIPVRLAHGDIDLRFFAMAAAPAPSIPLSAAYLRETSSSSSRPVLVGPRAAQSPERARFPGAAAVDASGLPARPLDPDFDFGFFNTAPAAQQVGVLRAGGVLTLEGLLPGRPAAILSLPSERPRVYYARRDAVRGGGGGGREPSLGEILLRCDTLWIDAARALAITTWRGEIAIIEGREEPELLVVTLAPFGLGESLRGVQARLDSAARGRAVEASDLAAGAEEIDAEELLEIDEVMTFTEEPPSHAEGSFDDAVQTALPFHLPPHLSNAAPGPALPFRPAPVAPPAVAPPAVAPPAVFRFAAPAAPRPRAAPAPPEPEAVRTALAFRLPTELLNRAPLPFRPPSDPAVARGARPPPAPVGTKAPDELDVSEDDDTHSPS